MTVEMISSRKYGTGAGSKSRPLELQPDSNLLPDTLLTALRGPVICTMKIQIHQKNLPVYKGLTHSSHFFLSLKCLHFTSASGDKNIQYCTCPAGRVTYNFHSSCKHMHLSFKKLCNKEYMRVICNMTYKVPYLPTQLHNCIPQQNFSQYSENVSFTLTLE